MIVASRDGRGSALTVTYPKRDRIAFFALLVLYPAGFLAYVGAAHRPAPALRLSVVIFLAGCCMAAALIRTRVVVRRDSIRERVIRTRQIAIPPGSVDIVRRGALVCVMVSGSTFEYRFPKGLAHGGRLEHELEQFFAGRGDSTP